MLINAYARGSQKVLLIYGFMLLRLCQTFDLH